jgi:hypothetical protein
MKIEEAPIFFDPAFTTNVMVGWLIMLAGAGLLLLTGVWWSFANEHGKAERAPTGWRLAAGLGFLLFILGWAWQIVGYTRVSVMTF